MEEQEWPALPEVTLASEEDTVPAQGSRRFQTLGSQCQALPEQVLVHFKATLTFLPPLCRVFCVSQPLGQLQGPSLSHTIPKSIMGQGDVMEVPSSPAACLIFSLYLSLVAWPWLSDLISLSHPSDKWNGRLSVLISDCTVCLSLSPKNFKGG